MTEGALPFRIEFTRRAIDDLHRRLDAARWPVIPFATGWAAGTHDGVLRDAARWWRREFDWFAVQERLNRLPHIRIPLGESEPPEEVHAVVLAGPGRGRVPLLLLHGWPGSFIEMLPAAQRLFEDEDGPGFDLVVPSLPGFGFSDAPRRPRMHPGRIASQMHRLMLALGYERYGVQGGDWGAVVGWRLAWQEPDAVLGLHLNFPAGAEAPDGDRSEETLAWRASTAAWRQTEIGYGQIQGTRPQTLGYALNDSPVGLLAWILEKFWAWTDHDDDLWAAVDREAVLANVTLYWLTGTALSSARTYYEARREDPPFSAPGRLEVPTAYTRYPKEPWWAPRSVVEHSYRIERWSEAPRGGHFAALEEPEWFASDVASFFRSDVISRRRAG